VGNSLRFALIATLLALTIGLAAAAVIAYRRGRVSQWFDALLMLPLGTSAVTIGFGFVVALDAPVDLRAAWWLVPVAHSLVAIPFVVRSVVPVMRSVRTRLREAAAVLGAPPPRVWREVDLPMVSRAALDGAGFAMAVSLGEFGATAFVARPDTPTMPIAIFRFLGRPGALNFGRAMAMSVILMLVTGLAVSLIERFRARGLGEF
jgi:thiamine transport system permease protein